jgi:hypothetical protein
MHKKREVTANRPDIKIKNKNERNEFLIYVTIPADRKVTPKEAELCKSLCLEIKEM